MILTLRFKLFYSHVKEALFASVMQMNLPVHHPFKHMKKSIQFGRTWASIFYSKKILNEEILQYKQII